MESSLSKILRHHRTVVCAVRNVSQSVPASSGSNWQEKKRLRRNPNKMGPLTDLPDYTFLNGDVACLGMNQRKRMLQQRELVSKIVTLSKEMDFALDRYERQQQENEQRLRIQDGSKLKSKGHLLLSK